MVDYDEASAAHQEEVVAELERRIDERMATITRSGPNVGPGQHMAITTILSAMEMSAPLDRFAGWSITAFGAALALFLVNLNDLSTYISTVSVGVAGVCFASSVICHIVQKYLAVLIAGGKASFEAASKGPDQSPRMDLDQVIDFLAELDMSFMPGWRGMFRRFRRRVLLGDSLAPVRWMMKGLQLQGLAVVLQTVFLVGILFVLAHGIAFRSSPSPPATGSAQPGTPPVAAGPPDGGT